MKECPGRCATESYDEVWTECSNFAVESIEFWKELVPDVVSRTKCRKVVPDVRLFGTEVIDFVGRLRPQIEDVCEKAFVAWNARVLKKGVKLIAGSANEWSAFTLLRFSPCFSD